MSDIREKLERLRRLKRVASQPPESPSPKAGSEVIESLRREIKRIEAKKAPAPVPPEIREPRDPFPDFQRSPIPEGRTCRTELGSCLLVNNAFPLHHVHGGVELGSLIEADFREAGRLGKNEALAGMNPVRTAFLDMETTGLAMGTGTYAFLVGIGYFEGDEFLVDQFFMGDYSEEAAMLHLVEELLGRADYMVTFNGKTYDLPLLETRFIMSHMPARFVSLPHLDLLHPARRLWRERMESCRLVSLERELLGLTREDDVPGELIPKIYFNYLKGRERGLMRGVFQHNMLDILSLVSLTHKIVSTYNDPYAAGVEAGEDFYSLGHMRQQLGRADESEAMYREALNMNLPLSTRRKALLKLSMLYKKERRLDEAAELWEILISGEGEADLTPYIEMAKYYEHRVGDVGKALELVESAMDAGIGFDDPERSSSRKTLDELEQRRRRLLSKLHRANR